MVLGQRKDHGVVVTEERVETIAYILSLHRRKVGVKLVICLSRKIWRL